MPFRAGHHVLGPTRRKGNRGFSEEAIELARSLSREVAVEAEFVLSNVYGLPDVLDEIYDIVFASYGVVYWLPDLYRWAEIIASLLKPGGTFYIVDFHPFANVFNDDPGANELAVHYPYFHTEEPLMYERQAPGTHADSDARQAATTYGWHHSMGDIVGSIVSAGLEIEFLHEFPYSQYEALPLMERGDDGWWRLKEAAESVPLMFSLKATERATVESGAP